MDIDINHLNDNSNDVFYSLINKPLYNTSQKGLIFCFFITSSLGVVLATVAGILDKIYVWDDSINWPQTISSLCADFSSTSGRIFFAFECIAGISFLKSNLLLNLNLLYKCLDTDRWLQREQYKIRHFACGLGISIVGMIPTVDIHVAKHSEIILIIVHMIAALLVFGFNPHMELIYDRCYIKNPWKIWRFYWAVLACCFFWVFIVLMGLDIIMEHSSNFLIFFIEFGTAFFGFLNIGSIFINNFNTRI